MARTNHTQRLARTEEALSVLFCLIDDAYALVNPRPRCYQSIKRLSDSELIALALFQQLRGVESERSFLGEAERFFSHLFPGVVKLAPSSFHRRVRKLRLPGAFEARRAGGPPRRSRDPADRFHLACHAAPQTGRPVRRFAGTAGGGGVPSASTG